MVGDADLKSMYKELRIIRDAIKKLNNKIEFIELALIGEEEINNEEAEELNNLAKEARAKGIEWDKFKARLEL